MARALPHPRALRRREPKTPRRILVLVKGPNPTFSYYLDARLRLGNALPFHVHSIDDAAEIDVDPVDAYVIVCRYVRQRQIAWLRRHRNVLAGTAYLIDDDIARLVAEPGGGLAYRAYLAWFGGVPLSRLNPEITEVWASTPALRDSLRRSGEIISVLPPAPLLEANLPPVRQAEAKNVTVAFHATDIHRDEHAFLVPVLKAVSSARPEVRLEVRARGATKALWLNSGIHHERLAVLPPLPWPVYQRESLKQGADIFVVPLSRKASNDVRSDTKRIDCCRLGAAGVFAEGPVYGRERVDGEILVAGDADSWISTVLRLVDSSDLRQRTSTATRTAVVAMADRARQGFPGLSNAPASSRVG